MASTEIIKRYPDIKSIISWMLIGFVLGVLITLLWHILLWKVTTVHLNNSKWIAIILTLILSLVLCYNRSVRCSITLSIPILFSSKGRSLVMALAFSLVATGPTKNIFNNVAVLTNSMSCGQLQLREALEKMLEIMRRPLDAIKVAITVAINEIESIINKVKVLLLHIKEMVLVVVAGIKNAFSWLGNIISVCNKEFGTPFDRCMRIADDAIEDCKSKLGLFKNLCMAAHLFSILCYTVKFIDVICVLVDFVNVAIINIVMTKLKQFTSEVKNIFDFSVTFDHDFYFKTMASKNIDEIGVNILKDLRSRMNAFHVFFGWLDILGSVLFFTIIIKIIYFQRKYLHNPSYNNKYITKQFVEIENVRSKNNQELLFPLTSAEANKYPRLTSCRLTRTELYKLARSMFFLTITCIQILCICLVDYSLFWLLAIITYYAHMEAGLEVPSFITIDVKGGGFIGNVLESIARAFESLNSNYTIDATPCLPKPKPPNIRRYWHLGGLCLLAWVLLALQPYGLRLRHVVMGYYYPETARERAVWLYQRLLMKRLTFFKFARRKARNILFRSTSRDDYSFFNWICARIRRLPILGAMFRFKTEDYCILCSKSVKEDKIACETIGCKAVYCENCYRESNNSCCICKNPIDYGDYSDLSNAKDSSDELTGVHT